MAMTKRMSINPKQGPPHQQRKRSRTGGCKDLYDGHSQDVMLAKSLIDPDHQCSVTTVKAYVTHVCAWFRYCRTLSDPSYTLVDEEKLSGFLTWATQTPRLPCKPGSNGSGGSSMSYQSARRYVEGGILALWRRYRQPGEANPLHALSYLNTKYAIREASSSEKLKTPLEKHFTDLPISQESETALVRDLLSAEHDPSASIRAWAFYCLGASTWIPGTRKLHLRLDSLLMTLRNDARLVEHTTVPMLEFRVNPDPSAPTARFAEVSIARNANPLVCPWFAIAMLIFQQWQAQPSAMAAASVSDVGSWLRQPLFLANTNDSLAFMTDDARVQTIMDEINPLSTQASLTVKGASDSMLVRKRDKEIAETLGLSSSQVIRLEKWRVHHRRQGVSRQQTFFDLALVLGGYDAPPVQSDTPHAISAPSRTRLQVPEHLLAQVFPWLNNCSSVDNSRTPRFTRGKRTPGGAGFEQTRSRASSTSVAALSTRQRSHSMSAVNSEDVARAERNASLRMMRELATVLLQDSAALLADPQFAPLLQSHPLFQHSLFTSRAFRDFCAYSQQTLSRRQTDEFPESMSFAPISLMSLPTSKKLQQGKTEFGSNCCPPLSHSLSLQPTAVFTSSSAFQSPMSICTAAPVSQSSNLSLPHSQRSALSAESLATLSKPERSMSSASFMDSPLSLRRVRSNTRARNRRHTHTTRAFETIGEEDMLSLDNSIQQQHQYQQDTAAATSGMVDTSFFSSQSVPSSQHFNPMLLSQPLPFPPQLGNHDAIGHTSVSPPSLPTSNVPVNNNHPPPFSYQAASAAFPHLTDENGTPIVTDTNGQPISQQCLMQMFDYLSAYNHQSQQPAEGTPATLLHPISTTSALVPNDNGQQQQQPMECMTAPVASSSTSLHFPRLNTESNESTPSPVITKNPFTNYPPSVLFGSESLSSQSAAAAVAAIQQQHPHLSEYFHNAAAAAAAAMSATSSTPSHSQVVAAPQPHPGHQKVLHASSSGSSLSATSTTPTPSSGDGSTSAASAAAVAAAALHYSIAPQKMQFKADHELFM